MSTEDEMTREMAQAIRDVINFSRFDEKYQALSRFDRQLASRKEYFELKLSEIAANNGVDKEEIRDWLKQMVRPESFGLEVHERNGEEYVVRM